MGRLPIDAYRGSEGDSDCELEALGMAIAKRFFLYAQRIVSRRQDHWSLQTFAEYRDIPIYKADFDDCFAIFAVEDQGDQGIWLTLMLAANRASKNLGGKAWDGKDMNFVRNTILMPRLGDFFE